MCLNFPISCVSIFEREVVKRYMNFDLFFLIKAITNHRIFLNWNNKTVFPHISCSFLDMLLGEKNSTFWSLVS